MLARAGAIPSGRGWTFEPKLDGFRLLVCTHAGFRARSRRGWDMTPLLPELAAVLPADTSNSTGARGARRDGTPRLPPPLHGAGWKAEVAPDLLEGVDDDEVAVYCAVCWAAEFGEA
jgi:hypothetical protein